jgi:hypothetical protein
MNREVVRESLQHEIAEDLTVSHVSKSSNNISVAEQLR